MAPLEVLAVTAVLIVVIVVVMVNLLLLMLFLGWTVNPLAAKRLRFLRLVYQRVPSKALMEIGARRGQQPVCCLLTPRVVDHHITRVSNYN